ncbi:MAG TPA: hydrogenase formation protein HypD [Mycobacterium sp.]|nr:hydrogenase formation protein HypD [Mycobacterium sp.]
MKFVDEFRDPAAARKLLVTIEHLAAADDGHQHFKFMEVCGGHTHTIYRHGIEHLLPENVELVHGPGCPVCVIPMGRIDDAMWLAEQPDVVFTCFGDMMRVPGSRGNLLDAKARGADVRFVYSPLDALKIATDNPDKQVVFFGIGFETTAPSTAVTLVRARELGLANYSVFCNHVMIIPPIKAILESPDLRLSGFIGPGHVSTVVGDRPYRFVNEVYHKPLVIAGFEPLDILAAVAMLLTQIREGRCEVENQYSRVVRREGNPDALALMAKVFVLRPHFEWRGLGFISQSALQINDAYADFDAEVRFEMPGVRVADPKACQCGEVLKGVLKPWECKVFGTACTPETPIGTCMVSPEGACAAYYNFGRMHRDAVKLAKRPAKV